MRGARERHVLLPARGLARVPRDDHAVVELVHVARAVHPLLEERGDERNLVDDVGTDLLEMDKASQPEVVVSTAEGDQARGRHRHRVPVPAGERELELREADFVALKRRAGRRVPLKRQILGPESAFASGLRTGPARQA